VTLNEIIYHRRVRVLDHAGVHGVAATCRVFGISRQSYYRWARRAERYGLLRTECRKMRRSSRQAERGRRRTSSRFVLARVRCPTDPRRATTPRASRRARGRPLGLGGAEDPAAALPRASSRACRRARADHRGRDRPRHQRGPQRSVRVLPLRGATGRFRGTRHLLRRKAEGRRFGLPADCDRHHDAVEPVAKLNRRRQERRRSLAAFCPTR